MSGKQCEAPSLDTGKKLRATASWVIAIAVGIVLCRSAMFHIDNGYAFLITVNSYQLCDRTTSMIAAATIPFLQLTTGLSLLFLPQYRAHSHSIALCIFAIFALVQIITISRGLNIACGCFAPSSDNPIGWQSISIPVGCAALSIIGLLLRNKFVGTS